jgi:hypothetical protein
MPVLISFIMVSDGVKFFEYLKNLGCQVSEEVHTVLPDSSEYGLYTCIKDGEVRAVFALHYIDHHYAALLELRENAGDREVLEALLKAWERGVWIAPVEPTLFIVLDHAFVRHLMKYSDQVQFKAFQYLEHYQKSESPWKSVLKDLTSALVLYSKKMMRHEDV